MDTDHIANRYPLFYRTCQHLQKTFFYRDVFKLCERIPVNYDLAEKLCQDAFRASHSDWDAYGKKLESLLKLGIEFLTLQASLEKTGSYRYSTFAQVEREVFSKEEGVDYLWGLYFSQIFWVAHHRAFGFFRKEFAGQAGGAKYCLDVPVGSGMFLTHFLLANPECRGVGVDLSKTAMHIAKELFQINDLADRTQLHHSDFYQFQGDQLFDRIICTEFIEHVEDPLAVLSKLKTLLADSGKIFLTTVVWAAQIDHIYLYKNVGEIREHISQSGLMIEKEYVQNIFDKDAGKLEDSKVALNYAAILTKSP